MVNNIYCVELIFVFTKYCLAVEIDEKGHTDRDLEFEKKKRQEALEKKLKCRFIRFNTSKENFDVDYEVSKKQTFISQFKENKNKELEDEIEKLKLQLANLGVRNNDVNDKKINNTVTVKILNIKKGQ